MDVTQGGPAGSQDPADTPTGARRNHRLPASDRACLRDMLSRMGLGAEDLEGVDPGLPVAFWQVFQGGTLLLEGEAAATLYVVRSGSFKAARVLEDGYEQVLSFALPGELLGSVALHDGRQASTVVALEDSTVYALAVRELRELRRQCPVLDVALQQALSRQLVRTSEAAAMGAAVSSDVRVARFLLWMSARMAEAGQSPRRLLLRMGRRDIASLLCVAHETVSRGFTNLAEAGYIATRRKEVDLLDLHGLHEFSLFTRGTPLDASAPRGAGESRARGMPASWLKDLQHRLQGTGAQWPDGDQGGNPRARHAVEHHGMSVPS